MEISDEARLKHPQPRDEVFEALHLRYQHLNSGTGTRCKTRALSMFREVLSSLCLSFI